MQLLPFLAVFTCMVLLWGGPRPAWMELLPVALLCVGALWWGLAAWQERRRAQRYVRQLRLLRRFADHLRLGSLGRLGYEGAGCIELSGRLDGAPVRLEVTQLPPRIRFEVWAFEADPCFEVEGRHPLPPQVPSGAARVVRRLQDQGLEWIGLGRTGLVATRRASTRTLHPERLREIFQDLVTVVRLCQPPRGRPVQLDPRTSRRARCPFCHDQLEDGSRLLACVGCGTPHHRACFHESGCTVLGCSTRLRGQAVG